MKFAREIINRGTYGIRLKKRQRAAALQKQADGAACEKARKRLGVRQPYAALTHCDNQPDHASRITHHASHPPHSVLRIPHSTSAFTLAEVLASLVFMAILIPVALGALSVATRAGEVAARKGEAALVAERVLNENVVTTNWNSSVQSGSVRQGVREFRWTLHNDPWNQDTTQNAMRQLSVEVIYKAQGLDYSVRMSTLVDSTPPGTQSNQVQ
jgi:competence protein ComGC